MTRDRWLITAAGAAAVTVVVAVQVVTQAARAEVAPAQGAPIVAAGTDALAGLVVVPERLRGNDYRRLAI